MMGLVDVMVWAYNRRKKDEWERGRRATAYPGLREDVKRAIALLTGRANHARKAKSSRSNVTKRGGPMAKGRRRGG